MTSSPFFRVKSLSKKNHISVAAKHNLRELQSERGAEANIDASRSQDNQILYGEITASAVKDYAEHLMREAGVLPLRQNAMRGIEFLFSLPPQSGIDEAAFFIDCLAWIKTPFPVPILSAIVHRDEDAPHMHVILLPLLDGRMQGSKLLGDRKRITALHDDFHLKVGVKYGLARNRPKVRLSRAISKKAAELVLNAIIDNPDLLLRSDVESAVLSAIAKDPEQILETLGLQMPVPIKPSRSFVEIMTKPCKPERQKYGKADQETPNTIPV